MAEPEHKETKVLFLDDDLRRHEVAEEIMERRYGKCLIVHAYSAREAIEVMLENEQFDIISIDYDLGSNSETGREVAVVLGTLPENRLPGTVIIHSNNYPEAEKIAAYLDGITTVELIPFPI